MDQIVGRNRELESFEREFDRLARGEGGVLALVGEPGIGKTRLLSEAIERSRSLEYLALVGRGDELQRNSPFGLFVDALDDHLASLGSQLEQWLAPAHLLQLGLIFPSLSSAVTGDVARLPSDRHRAYRAVRVLMERLADQCPVVLTLDDLQWADAGSQELFAYLVRNQPRRGGVLIIAAQRSQPLTLQPWQREGPTDGSFEYLELEPLDHDVASQLFPEDVDRSTRDQLLELSGGNPFYLEQLARSALRGGEQTEDADATHVPDVPRAVAIAIGSEISALSESTLAVLQAAAVVGDPFDPELVAETAGVSTGVALPVLDELGDLDLIRASDAPRGFRFRHPIVRRAVYDSAKPGWRLGAHARAAAALEARGEPPEGRAHHIEHSARVGDELAIALLKKAAEASAWRAPATAAGWFGAALSLLPDGEQSRQRRLDLTLQRATALGAAGQLELARDTLREMIRDLPRELTALRGQAVTVIAMVDQVLTNYDDAERLLLRTLHELAEQDLEERTMLRNGIAVGKMFQGDYQSAREWSMQAVGSARKIDPALNASSAGIVAMAEMNLGDVASSRRYMKEAGTLIDTMPDSDLAVRLYGLPWLAWTEHWHDKLAQAEQHFDRGIAIAAAAGQTALQVPLMAGQVANLARLGRLGEGSEMSQETIELAHVCGSDQYLGWAHALSSMIDTQRGELTSSLAAGERAVAAVAELPGSPLSALANCALAEAKLESGLPDQCIETVLGAVASPGLEPLQRGLTPRWYEVLTQAELALGNLDAADGWATRAEGDTLALKGRVAYARRARAAVQLAGGDPKAAAETALESVAAADASGAPIEAARGRLLAGVAFSQDGQRDDALIQLENARSALEELGANRYADQAAYELRRLGKHAQRRGRRVRESEGIGALTDRETELSQLVATGKTNRQIATELFISEKTVQNHLSSIFTKLGVSSRAAVAGMIERGN